MSVITDYSAAVEGIAARQQKQLSYLGSAAIAWRSAVHWDGKLWVSLAEEASAGESVPLFADGQRSQAKVVAFDSVTGLVLLETENDGGAGLAALADAPATLGSVAITLAFPSPDGPELSVGFVRVRPLHGRYFQTDSNLYQGFAGAAVLDGQERLAGIVAQVGRGNQSWILPAGRLRDRVGALRTHGSLVTPRIGVEVESIALRQGGRGLLVRRLTPNGPAETAGIRQGDILLSAAGWPLESSGSLIEALSALGINSPIQLERLRGDSADSISVLPDYRLGKGQE